MKKSLSLLASLLLLVLLVFSSCAADKDLKKLSQVGVGFYCDETIYTRVFLTEREGVIFCGEEAIGYDGHSSFFGLERAAKHYCSTSDYQVIGLFYNTKDPKNFWGFVPDGGIWVPQEPSEEVQSFLDGEYSSYKILSADKKSYYALANAPVENKKYFNTKQTSNKSEKQESRSFILNSLQGFSVLGCDSSGELGRIIGKVVIDSKGYYYFPIDYETSEALTGYQLSREGTEAFEAFLKNEKPIKPSITLLDSLEAIFEEERQTQELMLFFVIFGASILLLALIFFIFRRKIVRLFKGFWGWSVRQAKDGREWAKNRRRYNLEPPVADEDYKPLNLELSKEEILRNMPESSDEETSKGQSSELQFCPVCGAQCDWSLYYCRNCGVELSNYRKKVFSVESVKAPSGDGDLTVNGKRLYKVDPVNAPPSPDGGKGSATVLDVAEVSRAQFVNTLAPPHLRRSTKRFSVWYFILSALALLSSILVYGDMLMLTQSEVLSIMSLLPGVGLFVLAVLYRQRRSYGYAIVFAVYSVFAVLSTVITLAGAPSLGALTTGNPLDSVFYLIGVAVECVLYLLFSGLGLYRSLQLHAAYQDFKQGKGYRVR